MIFECVGKAPVDIEHFWIGAQGLVVVEGGSGECALIAVHIAHFGVDFGAFDATQKAEGLCISADGGGELLELDVGIADESV